MFSTGCKKTGFGARRDVSSSDISSTVVLFTPVYICWYRVGEFKGVAEMILDEMTVDEMTLHKMIVLEIDKD